MISNVVRPIIHIDTSDSNIKSIRGGYYIDNEDEYEIVYKDGTKKFIKVFVKYVKPYKSLPRIGWLTAIKTIATSTVKKVNGKWTYDTKVESEIITNWNAYLEDMSDEEYYEWCCDNGKGRLDLYAESLRLRCL